MAHVTMLSNATGSLHASMQTMGIANGAFDWADAAFWVLVNLAVVALGYMLAPVLIPRAAKSNVHDAADLISATPVFLVMTWLACQHTLDYHRADVRERWNATSPASYAFFRLYLVRQTISLPFMFIGSMKPSDKVLMSVHHVISIAAYGRGLLTGRMHWFGTLAGCCEISTNFLNVLLIFRAVGYKGILNTINGVTLWCVFLIFRLALFPYWLWRFGSDVFEHPTETAATVPSFELIFYPATIALLLAMSITWFATLTKGMLKVLGLSDAKAGKAD